MKSNDLGILTVVAGLVQLVSTSAFAAEPISCRTNYHMTSQMSGEAPGSLSTNKDTACRLSRNLAGPARGAPIGRADGFDVVVKPKNGSVAIENLSSFIFTPRKGFIGEDTMLIRMKFMNGSSGLVRFSISVS